MSSPPQARQAAAAKLSWLSASVALIAAELDPALRSQPVVRATVAGAPVEVSAEVLDPSGASPGERLDAVLVARLAAAGRPGEVRIALYDGDRELPAPVTDLRDLARRLAPLARARRESILRLLPAAISGSGSIDEPGLAAALRLLRDALREPLPRSSEAAGGPQLELELLARLDERRCFVAGWVRERGAAVTRLTAVSPEGARSELRGSVEGTDAASGAGAPADRRWFGVSFELEQASASDQGWIFELEDGAGRAVEAQAPVLVSDPIAARHLLLQELDRQSAALERSGRVGPAIRVLARQLAGSAVIDEIDQLGKPPESPEVTIVVPVGRRPERIERQLALLADDPELRRADLIYVLDPPGAAALLPQAPDLCELYGLAFRIAKLSRSVAFAASASCGAAAASASRLVFIAPDVIPRRPGWLGRLAAAGGSAAAVGPKLLRYDDSIDQAGVYFRQPVGSPEWEPAARCRGLPRASPAAAAARPVPALGAACMLVERDAYLEGGGIDTDLLGDEEAGPDLCLRLRGAGHEVVYAPQAELYRLDPSASSIGSRRLVRRYDSWLMATLWAPRIAELMSERRFADLDPALPAPERPPG